MPPCLRSHALKHTYLIHPLNEPLREKAWAGKHNKQRVILTSLLHRTLFFARKRDLSCAMLRWLTFSSTHVGLELNVQRAVRSFMARDLRACWRAWHARLKVRSSIRLRIASIVRSRRVAAVRAWCVGVARVTRSQRVARALASRLARLEGWRTRSLRAAFSRLFTERMVRTTSRRAKQLFDSRGLHHSFRAWLALRAARHASKARVLRVRVAQASASARLDRSLAEAWALLAKRCSRLPRCSRELSITRRSRRLRAALSTWRGVTRLVWGRWMRSQLEATSHLSLVNRLTLVSELRVAEIEIKWRRQEAHQLRADLEDKRARADADRSRLQSANDSLQARLDELTDALQGEPMHSRLATRIRLECEPPRAADTATRAEALLARHSHAPVPLLRVCLVAFALCRSRSARD